MRNGIRSVKRFDAAPGGLKLCPGPAAACALAFEAWLSEPAWAEIGQSLRLSGRELQTLRGVFNNLTEAALASELGISEHTAHTHLNRLFKKLGVTTRTQLVLRIVEQFFALVLSPSSPLQPICRHRLNGRCKLPP